MEEMYLKRILVTILFVFCVTLIFSGCSSNLNDENNNIKIGTIVTSIGSVEGDENNFNRQALKYTLYLINNGEDDIFVISIEPILGKDFSEIVETKNNKLVVNKNISGKQSMEIKGVIVFDATNLSKQEIIDLIFIEEFKITEERVIT